MVTTIVLEAGQCLPAAAMRATLARAAPAYNWTCGEDDDGSVGCAPVLTRDVLVTGRSAA